MAEPALPLQVVINNAGVMIGDAAPFHEATPEAMLQEYQVNTLGPFFVVQHLHKAGLIGGQAHTLVAQISSILGSNADTTPEWAHWRGCTVTGRLRPASTYEQADGAGLAEGQH